MTAPVRQSGRWMPTGADHLQEGPKAVCAGHWVAGYGDASVSWVKSRPGQLSGVVACRYEVHEATGQSIDGPLLVRLRVAKLLAVANAEQYC